MGLILMLASAALLTVELRRGCWRSKVLGPTLAVLGIMVGGSGAGLAIQDRLMAELVAALFVVPHLLLLVFRFWWVSARDTRQTKKAQ